MGLLGSLFGNKKLTSSELSFIRREEKILADSLKIIQTTDNLDTLFSRLKLAEKSLKNIAEIAGGDTKIIAQKQATANECLDSLEKEKSVQINNCVARYIKKETVHILGLSRGRMSKAKGVAAIIEEYTAEMPSQSADISREMAQCLIEKIKKVEGEK